MLTYQSIPIHECQEALADIPPNAFAFTDPPPYVALGAPYGTARPWQLRRRVLDALLNAKARLEARKPGWQLKLFDAYRPVPVQAFMVWREFHHQARLRGQSLDCYSNPADLANREPVLYSKLAPTVFTFWGTPSDDPRTPPPHSTGAAIDLTLQDALGHEVDMGCPIDETTERAYPDHFANTLDPNKQAFHALRDLLNDVMASAGFSRHPNEWWHFSLGDQMAALTKGEPFAIFGRAM